MKSRCRIGLAIVLWLSVAVCALASTITGRVVDDNGAPVSGARIELLREGKVVMQAESGEAGVFELRGADDGAYELRVQKAGFYVLSKREFRATAGTPVDLVLNHRQEYEEKVDVEYALPAIDLQKPASSTTLDAAGLVDIPYSSSHEFRNGLVLLPGIVRDNRGRVHLNGGTEEQVLYTLDGFNLSNPFTARFENHIPVDGIREIKVDSSRYAAEFGKSSAGTLAIASAAGDDSFRYGLTNFIPSSQLGTALFNSWTPRGTISGPWARGRAWFFNTADAIYNREQVDELPKGANQDTKWIANDLLRNQLLLGKSTLLSSTLLYNYTSENHLGLGARSPIETTIDHNERNYLVTFRGQHFRTNGALYEVGLGIARMRIQGDPLGPETFRVAPQGLSGNFFQRSHISSRRWQVTTDMVRIWNGFLGRHELKAGGDFNWLAFDRLLKRNPFETLRDDGTVWRRTRFLGPDTYTGGSFEQSLYLQDHWQLNKRLVLELGIRQDWNDTVRQVAWSPRVALAWSPFSDDNTKITAGWGLFYDAVSLETLAHDRDLDRETFAFAADGITPVGAPVILRWFVPPQGIRLPRTSNFSPGLERKLPGNFYLRSSYIHRRTSNGFAFLPPAINGVYTLGSARRDRYDALELRAEHGLGKGYNWMLSYTRSLASSNAAIRLPVTDPLFGTQGPGPVDWDTPNRLLSRAWIPIGKKYGVAYVAEWRSGYPFSAFSENSGLAGAPNSYRYPHYFSLNLEAERVFHLRKYRWGFRAGFVNLTNRRNPNTVNNSIDSPNFLSFAGGQHRAFVTRVRLIGKD